MLLLLVVVGCSSKIDRTVDEFERLRKDAEADVKEIQQLIK